MSTRRFCTLGVLFALFATCFFASAAQADVFTSDLQASGTTQTLSPSISSDKSDYAPGELVTLTGSNWQPGESVHVVVNDTAGSTWSYGADLTADASGFVSDSFNLPDWFVATYDVTATGASGTATTAFTDSAVTYTFPVAATPANSYTATAWNAGCATAGFCGGTNGGNVDSVRISIKQDSTGKYWNGSSFSSSSEDLRTPTTFVLGSGNNNTWTYNFSASSFPAAGSYTVSTQLWNSGSIVNNSRVSVTFNFASKQDQTINFGALANKTYGNPAFGVSASATSGLTVSFSASGNCTSGGANGATISITGAGSCTVTASQAGDSSYNAAPNVQQTFSIAKASPSITVNWADTTYDGTSHPATATVAGVGGANLGAADSLTYYAGSTATGTALAGAPTNAGTFTVRAHFNATTNYLAADQDKTITISKASQTISFAPLGNKTYGDAPFTVSATGGGSSNPVTFSVGTTDNCSSGGTNGATITLTGAGSCTVTASQAGDSDYFAATSVPRNFTIAKATPVVHASWSNTTFDGNDHPASSTVSGVGSPAADLGSADHYSYYAGSTATGTALAGAPTNAGTYTVKAVFDATANYESAFDTATITIAKASQTIHFTAPSGVTYGDSDSALGATADSGLDVTYVSSTSSNCTIVAGKLHVVGAGDCTIKASQGGNGNWNPAADVERTFSIDKAHQSITFAAPTGVTYGDSDSSLGATADSGLAVGYTSSTTPNCTIVAGKLHVVSAGTCTITAAQGGNSNYYSATSVERTFTIAKATLSVNADDKAKTIGAADPPGTWKFSGFQGSDSAGTVTVTGSAACSIAAHAEGVGTYSAVYNCSGGDLSSANYKFAAGSKGNLTIGYRWDGFLQPINDTAHQIGTLESKFKLGSTIPVKFQIKNDSGASIQQSVLPTFQKTANRGPCDSATALETIYTDTPTDGGAFRWDTSQYIYNWSTKGLTAGEYRINAVLADGTKPYVDICLTK